jgi:hypothetical protein
MTYAYTIEFVCRKTGNPSAELGGAYDTLDESLAHLMHSVGYHLRREDAPIVYLAVVERLCERCQGSGRLPKNKWSTKPCTKCHGVAKYVERVVIDIPLATARTMACDPWWPGEGPRP